MITVFDQVLMGHPHSRVMTIFLGVQRDDGYLRPVRARMAVEDSKLSGAGR
jgi:hypothetical protein